MSKELLGELVASRVKDGDTIGLGSGTTAEAILRKIGARIRTEQLRVFGAPSAGRAGLDAAALA